MAVANSEEQEVSAAMLKQKQIDQYWAGDLARTSLPLPAAAQSDPGKLPENCGSGRQR